MFLRNTCRFNACGILGIIISVIFGAIIGILFAIGLIPLIVVSAWIAFGLGVLTLIFLFIDADLASIHPQSSLNRCLRAQISCLLAGTIGTIISALAILSIIPLPIFIAVVILVAIGAFFFSLMVIGWIALLKCILCRHEDDHECDHGCGRGCDHECDD